LTIPFLSPVLGDLKKFPPLLIQSGTSDILFPDVEIFAKKAEEEGVDIEFEKWENMMHVWHAAHFIPESKKAISNIGIWLDKKISTNSN
ncbi:MAG: monoterpene epsilon-lactone hydrolase, partial [Limisphaerales bacterium]